MLQEPLLCTILCIPSRETAGTRSHPDASVHLFRVTESVGSHTQRICCYPLFVHVNLTIWTSSRLLHDCHLATVLSQGRTPSRAARVRELLPTLHHHKPSPSCAVPTEIAQHATPACDLTSPACSLTPISRGELPFLRTELVGFAWCS